MSQSHHDDFELRTHRLENNSLIPKFGVDKLVPHHHERRRPADVPAHPQPLVLGERYGVLGDDGLSLRTIGSRSERKAIGVGDSVLDIRQAESD